ncbi:unnamed protein product [Cuscuta campestris]|uniref:Uncharacterized protein n=1 Tax=Cuscuta campestris TaxID=132261 RepID=A0A484LBE7_9ASTE|nr:unnamed protein product [Cuscuta campestris]
MYYCMYCACRVLNVTPRYLIKLAVRDDYETTTFMLFDQEASSILNTSCSKLLEKIDVDGSTENPAEFGELFLGKSFLFKVEVRSMFKGRMEQSFRVSKICHDATVLTWFIESATPKSGKNNSNREGQIYSVGEDFFHITKATTIESLKDCTEDGEYAIYGTIIDSDWFIAMCRCGAGLKWSPAVAPTIELMVRNAL